MTRERLYTYRHPAWLTNTYLLQYNGDAVLIDAGTGPGYFEECGALESCKLHAILLTHSHSDHVDHLSEWVGRAPIYAHRDALRELSVDGIAVKDYAQYQFGSISAQAIETPGHCSDHVCYYLRNNALFSGDLLFKGSVGGTRNGSCTELRRSLCEKLLNLPGSTRVLPGHAAPTVLDDERRGNPFIRMWMDGTPALGQRCRLRGEDAELLVLARDYDGEGKALLRVSGREEVVADDELSFPE